MIPSSGRENRAKAKQAHMPESPEFRRSTAMAIGSREKTGSCPATGPLPLLILLLAATGSLLLIVWLANPYPLFLESTGQKERIASGFPNDELATERIQRQEELGRLTASDISESSGICLSARYPDCLWTHNDSGSTAELFLVRTSGELLAHVEIEQASCSDWEAITQVSVDGKTYIAVGDIGDNSATREECRIYVIEEPEIGDWNRGEKPLRISTTPLATIRFRWPEGAMDCEAMAWDPVAREFWFVSKPRPGPSIKSFLGDAGNNEARAHMYRLAWSPDRHKDDQVVVVERLESRFSPLAVTGMDIHASGKKAVVRNYWTAFVFERPETATWSEAFSKPPSRIVMLPDQRQGEAVAFDSPGTSILLTSEGVGQRVLKVNLPESENPSMKNQVK